MINVVKSPEGEQLFKYTVFELVDTMGNVKDSIQKLLEASSLIAGNLRSVRSKMGRMVNHVSTGNR